MDIFKWMFDDIFCIGKCFFFIEEKRVFVVFAFKYMIFRGDCGVKIKLW